MPIRLPHFRPQREQRIRSLIARGFQKREAIILTKPRVTVEGRKVRNPLRLYSKAKTGSPVASTQMIRERQELMRWAKRNGVSKAAAIASYYQQQGFLDNEGMRDPWGMFRRFLDDSPAGRKKRPGSIGKGDVAAQKARRREKERDTYGPALRMPRGLTREEQIARLQEEAGRTESPTRRQQLYGQVYKLERQKREGR